MNCGEASPADPYFFYHIKASEEEQMAKKKAEKRASKYAIKDWSCKFFSGDPLKELRP